MKTIGIEIPDGKKAEWVNEVLMLVDEKNITERIKTFTDALNEIGGAHPFAVEYFDVCGIAGEKETTSDLKAYLKLRVICAALNKNWRQESAENNWYYPWFYLYAKCEVERMTKEQKEGLGVMDVDLYNTKYAGIAFETVHYAPSSPVASIGSHLCLKTKELAEYCGKQFINIWADYLLLAK